MDDDDTKWGENARLADPCPLAGALSWSAQGLLAVVTTQTVQVVDSSTPALVRPISRMLAPPPHPKIQHSLTSMGRFAMGKHPEVVGWWRSGASRTWGCSGAELRPPSRSTSSTPPKIWLTRSSWTTSSFDPSQHFPLWGGPRSASHRMCLPSPSVVFFSVPLDIHFASATLAGCPGRSDHTVLTLGVGAARRWGAFSACRAATVS